VYLGSIAKQGEMTGVVTATGMNTYFGKTARLVEQAKTVSHFQRAVLRIGNFLILVTIGLVLVDWDCSSLSSRPAHRNRAICPHPHCRINYRWRCLPSCR
jgi:magnesium-transporting ATPase (P-type)